MFIHYVSSFSQYHALQSLLCSRFARFQRLGGFPWRAVLPMSDVCLCSTYPTIDLSGSSNIVLPFPLLVSATRYFLLWVGLFSLNFARYCYVVWRHGVLLILTWSFPNKFRLTCKKKKKKKFSLDFSLFRHVCLLSFHTSSR